jgi:hypothetical protein
MYGFDMSATKSKLNCICTANNWICYGVKFHSPRLRCDFSSQQLKLLLKSTKAISKAFTAKGEGPLEHLGGDLPIYIYRGFKNTFPEHNIHNHFFSAAAMLQHLSQPTWDTAGRWFFEYKLHWLII